MFRSPSLIMFRSPALAAPWSSTAVDFQNKCPPRMFSTRSFENRKTRTPNVELLSPLLGAKVSPKTDLKSINPDVLKDLVQRYGVVVFPTQNMSVAQLSDLGLRLGDEVGSEVYSNFGKEGSGYVESDEEELVSRIVYGADEKHFYFQQDLARWHMDHSYRKRPTGLTILQAEKVPASGGGQTMFLNAAAAFSALTPSMQDLLVEGAQGQVGVEILVEDTFFMNCITFVPVVDEQERSWVEVEVLGLPDFGKDDLCPVF